MLILCWNNVCQTYSTLAQQHTNTGWTSSNDQLRCQRCECFLCSGYYYIIRCLYGSITCLSHSSRVHIYYSVIAVVSKSQITDSHGNYMHTTSWARVLMQWLKLPAGKVGDRWFKPGSGIQVSTKQNVSSLLTRKKSIFWGASVTARLRARPMTTRVRISNPVSGG